MSIFTIFSHTVRHEFIHRFGRFCELIVAFHYRLLIHFVSMQTKPIYPDNLVFRKAQTVCLLVSKTSSAHTVNDEVCEWKMRIILLISALYIALRIRLVLIVVIEASKTVCFIQYVNAASFCFQLSVCIMLVSRVALSSNIPSEQVEV